MEKGEGCKTWGNVGGWDDYKVSIVDPQEDLKDRDGDDVSDCAFDSLLQTPDDASIFRHKIQFQHIRCFECL